MRKLLFGFVVVFGAQTLCAAKVGGDLPEWFVPSNIGFDCIQNMAVVCKEERVGVSKFERAQQVQNFSIIQYNKEDVLSTQDSTTSFAWKRGGLELLSFSSLSHGTAIGISVLEPQFSSEKKNLNTGETLISQSPSFSASFWFGVDFLNFIKDSKQHLIVSSDLPIAYEPGLWTLQGEWVWDNIFRTGIEWSTQNPRMELSNAPGTQVWKLKTKKEKWKAFLGMKILKEINGEFVWDWTDMSPSSDPNALNEKGWIESKFARLNWKHQSVKVSVFGSDENEEQVLTQENDQGRSVFGIKTRSHFQQWVVEGSWQFWNDQTWGKCIWKGTWKQKSFHSDTPFEQVNLAETNRELWVGSAFTNSFNLGNHQFQFDSDEFGFSLNSTWNRFFVEPGFMFRQIQSHGHIANWFHDNDEPSTWLGNFAVGVNRAGNRIEYRYKHPFSSFQGSTHAFEIQNYF